MVAHCSKTMGVAINTISPLHTISPHKIMVNTDMVAHLWVKHSCSDRGSTCQVIKIQNQPMCHKDCVTWCRMWRQNWLATSTTQTTRPAWWHCQHAAMFKEQSHAKQLSTSGHFSTNRCDSQSEETVSAILHMRKSLRLYMKAAHWFKFNLVLRFWFN